MYSLLPSSFAIAALLCSVSCETGPASKVYPIGDVRNCAIQDGSASKSLDRMDVLPGLGFDNLRNLHVDLGQVMDYNYSTCQVSGDGLYLVPDNVYT